MLKIINPWNRFLFIRETWSPWFLRERERILVIFRDTWKGSIFLREWILERSIGDPLRIYSFELIKYECFMWIISFLICFKRSFLLNLFLILIFFTRSCKTWLHICQNGSWNYLTTRHTKNSYRIWSVEELCKVIKKTHNLDWCREKDYEKIIMLMLVE